MNEVTGIGQQKMDIHEAQNMQEMQKGEQTQGSRQDSEKMNYLKKPRYDEYISEKKAAPSDKNDTKKCTVNTDKVDREIKKLKEKKKELEGRLSGLEEGTEEWERLWKQLKQVEVELKRKDTDSYRRQHAEKTEL